MRSPEFSDGAYHRFRAEFMKALQRADGRKHDGQTHLAPEMGHAGIDLADVAQHARAQRHGVERHTVAPQRGLGLHPADDVIPVVLAQILPRLGDDFVQVEEIAGARCDVVDGSLRGRAFLHVAGSR
jgi:hypothetical protein